MKKKTKSLGRWLFSVRNSKDKKHKELTLFGLKIKFKFHYRSKELKRIFSHRRKNSVLVVEPNTCHYEVIPGYVRYFEELGYKVDIAVREKSAAEFLRGIFPGEQVYALSKEDMDMLVADKDIRRYKWLLFTSAVKYVTGIAPNSLESPSVWDYFPKIAMDESRLIFVQHHQDRSCIGRQITLADLKNDYSKKFCIVNPHYFGDVKITPKNKKVTKFIVVGNIAPWRKNFSLLIDAVRDLSKLTDCFKVILVGGGKR